MVAEVQGANTSIKLQRIDCEEQTIENVVTLLPLLAGEEMVALCKVSAGLGKDLDSHLVESRICRFASAHWVNWEAPSSTRFSQPYSTSACHAGDGTSSGLRERSSPICARARSLSAVVIRSSGSVNSMELSSCLLPARMFHRLAQRNLQSH